jgi:hypothetical protein
VVQLHESRQWFDATFHRVDPPYGFEQHCTRPFDVLLLVGAWALSPLAGFEKALHFWAALISPLLHVFSALFLVWACSPVFNRRRLAFLVLAFIAQPAVVACFLAGRPDHHSLMTFLFVVSLGFSIRMMHTPSEKKWTWGGGFVSALAFWVCIEAGIFIILPIIVLLSVLWFLKEKDIGSALFNYASSLLLFSVGALLIQNGWGEFFRPEVDRISIIFIFFFFMVTVYAFFVRRYDFNDKIFLRVLFSGAAGIGILAVMQAVYPQVFSGYEVDPLYSALRSPFIGQAQRIFRLEWPQGPIRFIFWAGITMPTFFWFLHSLFTQKWWQALVSRARKDIYVKLSIFAIVCLILSVQYVIELRFVVYLEIVCLLGYVVFMDNIISAIESRFEMSKALYVVRPLIIVIMISWFYYPMIFYGNSEGEDIGSGYNSDIVATSKYIQEMSEAGERPLNIMAAPELGTTILYYTKNNVYNIQGHRAKQGFRDWYHLMAAETDKQAISIIKKREVDMILVNKPLAKGYFGNPKNTFLARLLAGKDVPWLDRVEVPEDLAKDILIYMVVNRNDY